jgi:protein-tyrosine phosphatase
MSDVPTTESGSSQASGDRRLPLEGAWNFRDVGGYLAGRQRVRWGRLYRSSRLSDLSDADCERLRTLDIRLVCDLRRAPGRVAAPSRLEFGDPSVLHAPATTKAADEFDELFASGERRIPVYREVLVEGYRQLARDNCDSWSKVVRALLEAEEGAAIVHCTAGQDRTGMMIAILLLALGVAEETVVEDYCLSARFGPPDAEFEGMIVEAVKTGSNPVGVETLRKILAPSPDLLMASFEAMRDDHDSIEGYLHEALALTDVDIAGLRKRLLE